ncbi:MAG: hypothetical protein ABEI99_03230 [Halobaculum sp.]
MTEHTSSDESTTDGDAATNRDETTARTATDQTDLPDGGTATGEPDTDPERATTTGTASQTDAVLGGRFRRWVNYLVLAALAILALVAGVRFYAAVGTMIDRFVVREFRPVFHATFNLALLFLAGAGVTLQLRRMR